MLPTGIDVTIHNTIKEIGFIAVTEISEIEHLIVCVYIKLNKLNIID